VKQQNRIGKYEIIERLGRGGMAEVYRAYHAELDRYVAIKVLHHFLSEDESFKLRFAQEAQNIAKLRHPNIVQVYDFEYAPEWDSYYMVMELIEGPTLRDLLIDEEMQTGKALALSDALRITREAANALSYAHKRGMIHRDVKPANLMLDAKDNNRVVLTDFGIAKLLTSKQMTMSGGLVGTPAYMSPEQGMGETGDERSDIYALGIIFYQMLTGELPYNSDQPVVLLLSHMHDPIPSARAINPHLPPAVDRVIETMLAKQPQDRYQSAQDVIKVLEILEKRPSQLDPSTMVLPKLEGSVTRPVPPPYPTPIPDSKTQSQTMRIILPPEEKKPRWWIWPIALILGAVIGIGGYAFAETRGVVPPLLVAAVASPSPTATLTASPSPTLTPTVTLATSPTSTRTPTVTRTPSATQSPSPTPRVSATRTPTRTPSPTFSATPTPSATRNVTSTPTENVTATIAAQRTATTAACNFDYAIIEQTPADGVDGGFFPVDSVYTREIRLLNTGTCAWEPNTSLTWLEGESFNVTRVFLRETVEPGQEVVLVFEGTLPRAGQTDPYTSSWRLLTPGQVPIGQPLTISVQVYDPGN